MRFEEKYALLQDMIEKALTRHISMIKAPEPLLGAMRYSLLAGGKRIRPALLLAACEMAGGDMADAMPFAVAIEMIHTYSLIHDDLPAMDDDDFRRGRPTNHKVYGEGMAILAGDGLLSLAFETMLQSAQTVRHIRAMRRIAKAAGVSGMVAGQCVDMAGQRADADQLESIHHHKAADLMIGVQKAEGDQLDYAHDRKTAGLTIGAQTADAGTLEYIHLHKTADLMVGAVTAGLMLAGATDAGLSAGEKYALSLGLAFQINDDLLDVLGDEKTMGKRKGMDEKKGKLTWPGFYGVEASVQEAEKQREAAIRALSVFGENAAFLVELAAVLGKRSS